MKPVNQNNSAPDGQSVPKKVHTLPDAPNGGGTADGYVLLPAYPSPEMLGAFWRTKNTGTTEVGGVHQDSSDVAAYRAMIAAAPPGPWPEGTMFATWAAMHDIYDCNGAMGFRRNDRGRAA